MMASDTYTPAGEQTMARAARTRTLYEALVALPEGVTGEIFDGPLHTQPRPAMRHAAACSVLAMRLGRPYHFGAEGPLMRPRTRFLRRRSRRLSFESSSCGADLQAACQTRADDIRGRADDQRPAKLDR